MQLRRGVAGAAAAIVITGALAATAVPVVGAAAARSSGAGGADFDGDGYDDLAVGAPGEDVGSIDGAGNVTVAYGGPDGAGSGGTRVVRQGLSGVPGDAEAGDRFGSSVTAGDFDGDGYDDLAAGAPGETVRRRQRIGNVTVVYGGPAGLSTSRAAVFRQGQAPAGGIAEPEDEFASAVAAGDLDGDGYDDLAVGARFEDVGDVEDAGNVTVLFGGPAGLGSRGLTVRQGLAGVAGEPETLDLFGSTIAIGDMDGDGFGDLAAGAPLETVGTAGAAGTVTIVPGGPGGLDEPAARVVTADRLACGCLQDGMLLGSALATGDVNADGFADLAVGAPGWSSGLAFGAGNVSVVFGTAERLDPSVTLDEGNVGLVVEGDDHFGSAVAFGDVDADTADDLLVAAPGEDVDGVGDAGLVVLVEGAGAEFPGGSTTYDQADLGGIVEPLDLFGTAVSTGDFSGDGADDLVIAAPPEDVGAVAEAGNVSVLDTTGGARPYNQGTVGGIVEASDVFGAALAP